MFNRERTQSRLRTFGAILYLCRAHVLLHTPFHRWRLGLGLPGLATKAQVARTSLLAAHIVWAAKLLPGSSKCLPQAMALSWVLRRDKIPHIVVFAVRPPQLRKGVDALHAWVESDGRRVIGDLPGPWIETLRLTG